MWFMADRNSIAGSGSFGCDGRADEQIQISFKVRRGGSIVSNGFPGVRRCNDCYTPKPNTKFALMP
jgi:hypothetical protein